MMFLVMCRTSGGPSGTRQAPMKENGMILTFHTRDEAEQKRPVNKPLATGAYLEYWVTEYEYWPTCKCGHIAEDHNQERPSVANVDRKDHGCDRCSSCLIYQPNDHFVRIQSTQ